MVDSVLHVQVRTGSEFDWDHWYGPHAERLMVSVRSYDFDRAHENLRERFNADMIGVLPGCFAPLSLHYGDFTAAQEYTNIALQNMRRAMEQPNQDPESIGITWGVPCWCFFATVTGMVTTDQEEVISGLMTSYGLTWAKADETLGGHNSTLTRPRGDTAMDVFILSEEWLACLCKCAHLLISRNLRVTKSEVVESLPSVALASEWARIWTMGSVMHASHGPWLNLFVSLALVCEKFECWRAQAEAALPCRSVIPWPRTDSPYEREWGAGE